MATPIQTEQGIPTQAPTTGPDASSAKYTEEDLNRVRTQEKDKLYREIESLRAKAEALPSIESELATMRQEREREAAEKQAAAQAADDAARVQREAEMSAKELLDERQREWENKFAALEAEREAQQQLLDKERQFAQLRDYTQARVAQEQSSIAPELLDLVDGNTPEEVDASIERLKAKSAAIAEKVRGTQQSLAAQQQGVSPAGFNATGPMDMLPTTQNYTAEDIAAMTPREYAEKVRPTVMGRGNTQRNRGLYG